MAKGTFEVSLTNPALSGTIEADVYEQGGVAPTTIIDYDQEWGVKIKWQLSGSLVPFICGSWCVSLYFESMGAGPEFDLHRTHTLELNPCGSGKYDYDFRVPRGTIRKEHCGRPYKVVAAVTFVTKCGKPGPMAGYVEGPMIQFYESPTINN
ncbi:MAG: hypothetical protein SF097_00310 [Acidobacteriota bacterium]|nr:hypothetical protein [Acidobacteriota bacterium]